MNEFASEREQIEALKRWWNENGRAVIAGVAFGVVGLIGWRTWQAHVTAVAEEASWVYQQMVSHIVDIKTQEAQRVGEQLIKRFENSPYASLASLMLAKLRVEANDPAKAKQHLQWVLDHSTQPELQWVARTRLARLFLAEGDIDKAGSLIGESEGTTLFPSYQELKGDILVAQGKPDEARKAYLQALTLGASSGDQQPTLQMKLEELGEESANPTQVP